jgi:hypothetical protein
MENDPRTWPNFDEFKPGSNRNSVNGFHELFWYTFGARLDDPRLAALENATGMHIYPTGKNIGFGIVGKSRYAGEAYITLEERKAHGGFLLRSFSLDFPRTDLEDVVAMILRLRNTLPTITTDFKENMPKRIEKLLKRNHKIDLR